MSEASGAAGGVPGDGASVEAADGASVEAAGGAPVEAVDGASVEAAGGAPVEAVDGLSARDRAVLDIAGRTWTGPGPRERAIRERLDISPTAYFQLLNALLDDPRALRHAPVTVNRLRAERDRHRAAR